MIKPLLTLRYQRTVDFNIPTVYTVGVLHQDASIGDHLPFQNDTGVFIKQDAHPDWHGFNNTLWVRGREHENDNNEFRISIDELRLLAITLAQFNGRKNVSVIKDQGVLA